MSLRANASAKEPGGDPEAMGAALTSEQFAIRYQQAHRTLWYIAAAILGDRTSAHDVVQEAAAIAMGKLDEFDPSTNFVAWMGQIVRYVALNEARSRQRRKTKVTSPDAITSVGGNPHPSSSRPGAAEPGMAQFDEDVASMLMTLDETARTCLLLRVVQGMAYHEIATSLGIPEGTAMSHVHRSRTALRERLQTRVQGAGRGRS
jgi:RNA polymerase sigma-70 factor, ECF subfamily